ncbi:MAG: cytidine deaminase [Halobacteriovorax sp.]|nr:cytidine deaminase [Halobacteriovorax sp.]|tara:strand:- start:78061 stop:78453 length:393 start_codon:yes stop_codon:yes gene_type:complete
MSSELREAALNATKNCHAPYSNAFIGAAIQTTDGEIISGCNVENASYPGCICAEQVAIVKAISEGKRNWSSIYVYSKAGWPPCGVCRQVMSEFAPKSLKIIIGDDKGNEKELTLGELLPHSFTPEEYSKN